MKKLKIFLDTSVYSAIFDNRDPNRQKLTQDFWDTIGYYDVYYSEIITEEISEGLIPEKYENDAILVALTSVYSLDILVSWNFKHLVKRKTRIGVNLINLKNGYKSIEILAPPEL